MTRILRHTKLLGIAFLALLLGMVYLTYAIFSQKFTSFDNVTLDTTSVGLQLPQRADVKIRGVIVGEVRDQEATSGGAKLTLGIYPDKMNEIPANVTGSIIPKTLFGEKYVSLVIPSHPSSQPIKTGQVITHTRVSTEVEAVLNNLYPLLEAVRPVQLKMTLDAISTALEGRGNELGQTLETTDAYLKRINPQIPALITDLRKTSSVADTYADVLPQVGQILDNTITTTTTLKTRDQKLHALFDNVTSLSDTLRTFLSQNEESLVEDSHLGDAQLRILSRYSTEFPCLLRGIVASGKLEAQAFRGFELHIVLETIPRQPRGYTAADVPRYGETRGPNCLHLPHPPWSQANPVRRVPNFNDGVDTPTGKGTDRVSPGFATSGRAEAGAGITSSDGYVGSLAETDLYRRLLAPGMGVRPDQVGDLGALLVAPMARGEEVSLQ